MEILEQKKFRPVLEEIRREIVDRQRKAGMAISQNEFANDPVLDWGGKAEVNSQLAVSVVLCEHASTTLRAIRQALGRIQKGEFGDCLECEEAIPLLRLQAMPYTPFCFQCQEKAERRGPGPSPEVLFSEGEIPQEELTSEERAERRKKSRSILLPAE